MLKSEYAATNYAESIIEFFSLKMSAFLSFSHFKKLSLLRFSYVKKSILLYERYFLLHFGYHH